MRAKQNNLTGVESATRRSFSFKDVVAEEIQSDRDAAERKILAFAMKVEREARRQAR
ncbi:hypothetical protein CH379_019825 [Leptospira ellisii]|uniref:Uncharacterized protein n=1 Tax=Leptospira ellisii TaxID=2023197 RepID=A0AAE4QSC2_9LEPT|nr:hypothetical protein [Leptospira ellisii]MDV6237881.1 hypothetical protein [Leptospira ellisii]